MIGNTISHYNILEKLGEGGMGVVYKATDTKLNRLVALKFLTSRMEDGKEEQRFIREAQAAASLNHAHIATVHEIDEVDGQMFIAMEFIDGLTLQEKIDQAPLKLEDVLDIAMQISEGLQEAHEMGVVHRDIKPANVMLTPKGKAKIMDFGLAMLSERSRLTRQDTTVGTISYMSPEQAQGSDVDQRSDIFSLGVLLYVMITGQLPFKGLYEQAVVYSILHVDPEPVTGLRSGVPMALERIVNKAMEKDPAERYQRVEDLLVDLRSVKKNLDGSQQAASTRVSQPIYTGTIQWQTSVPWGMAILGIGLAGWFWSQLQSTSPEQRLVRFTHPLPANQQFARSQLAIAPDGSQLVYAAWDSSDGALLYRRNIDHFDSYPIQGTAGAYNPFFSPDGQSVGFFASGKLKKISLADGAVDTICDAPNSIGASWGPDDTIVFSSEPTYGLMRVSATGGAPEQVTFIESELGELSHSWPEFLPDGQSVLFTVNMGLGLDQKRVEVLSLNSGNRKIVIEDGSGARYAASGHIVYLRAPLLHAVPFDVDRLEVTGPAVKVLEDVVFNGGSSQFAVSRNGTLVSFHAEGASSLGAGFPSQLSTGSVRQPMDRAGKILLTVERSGQTQPLPFPIDGYWIPSFSPDGQQVAVTVGWDIYILDLNRLTSTRFTFEGDNHIPIWSPDGQSLTFSSNRNGQSIMFQKRVDGSSTVEPLTSSNNHQDPGSWSPDGTLLAYAEFHAETRWDIWLIDSENNQQPIPFLQTRFNEYHPMISTDGRWLAYTSDESGRPEVYVRSFPEGPGKWLISTSGGQDPLWSPDGKELFYLNHAQQTVMAVTLETSTSFVADKPVPLIELEFATRREGFGRSNYDVSSDGQFLMLRPTSERRPTPKKFNFVLNWFDELERRVPSGN